VMDEPMRQVRQLVEEPASELRKTGKDVGEVFAGKMPHLDRRPQDATAAAFDAATAPSSTPSPAPMSEPDEASDTTPGS
jgi:hypothetical protein